MLFSPAKCLCDNERKLISSNRIRSSAFLYVANYAVAAANVQATAGVPHVIVFVVAAVLYAVALLDPSFGQYKIYKITVHFRQVNQRHKKVFYIFDFRTCVFATSSSPNSPQENKNHYLDWPLAGFWPD